MLLRKVPETRLQVAVLSHFLAPGCLNHPLARFRKDPRQRQITAEMIQVIQQMVFNRRFALTPMVTFGEARSYDRDLLSKGERLKEQILTQARSLLVAHTP